MGRGGADLEVAQGVQFGLTGDIADRNLIGKAHGPTGGGDHLLAGYPRVQRGHHELVAGRLRLHDAQVGDDPDGTGTRQAQAFARVAAFAVTNRGNEVQLVDKGTCRLLEDDQYAFRRAGDFRGATGTGQADLGRKIVADHRGVDIAETVDLGRAEKTDINAPALQPVAEDLTGRHHGVGGFSQFAVANGQRQHTGLGANRARLVDQYHVRRRGQARQVGSLGGQADADKADRTVLQTTGGSHRHHFIGGVGHHLTSEAWASLLWNSAKFAVPWMYSSIQAVKVARSRAIGSQAW